MASLLGLLLPPVAMAAGGYLLSSWLTGRSIPLAHKLGAIAHPNERSSHREPTPRIGGVGLVGGLAVMIAINYAANTFFQKTAGLVPEPVPWREPIVLLATLLAAFGLGLWDDLKSPPALVKLVGQAAIALIPALGGLAMKQLAIPFMGLIDLPVQAGMALTWLWVMAMMNVVNFMDGINGLAARFLEIFGYFLFFCTFNVSFTTHLQTLSAAVVGAAWGFARWNAPAARTFMGDCGSQAAGALAACLSLVLTTSDFKITYTIGTQEQALFMPFVGCLIAVSPFVFDVLFTMARRTLRGENILKAHREHLYQRAVKARGENHEAVLDMMTWVLAIAALMGLGYVRMSTPSEHGLRSILIGATVFLLGWYWTSVVKSEKRAGIL